MLFLFKLARIVQWWRCVVHTCLPLSVQEGMHLHIMGGGGGRRKKKGLMHTLFAGRMLTINNVHAPIHYFPQCVHIVLHAVVVI